MIAGTSVSTRGEVVDVKAWSLRRPAPIEDEPLAVEEVSVPEPSAGEITLQVRTCGICRTDLHIAEGDIMADRYPLVPGHQVVGIVQATGAGVDRSLLGQRRGAYWMYCSCGECDRCARGRENLCRKARFTGFDAPGGFAERMIAHEEFTVPIGDGLSDAGAAPLLCAGIIGYRALRLSDLREGESLALFGFGASAHLVAQVARYWGCEFAVYTRSLEHQELARELGAVWVGSPGSDEGPVCDRAITFAPVGEIVPMALNSVRDGGTVAVNAVSMTDIPSFPYQQIYGERTLRSVANVTKKDAREFMRIAAEIPIRTTVQQYPFGQLNQALNDLKRSRFDGAAVLCVDSCS